MPKIVRFLLRAPLQTSPTLLVWTGVATIQWSCTSVVSLGLSVAYYPNISVCALLVPLPVPIRATLLHRRMRIYCSRRRNRISLHWFNTLRVCFPFPVDLLHWLVLSTVLKRLDFTSVLTHNSFWTSSKFAPAQPCATLNVAKFLPPLVATVRHFSTAPNQATAAGFCFRWCWYSWIVSSTGDRWALLQGMMHSQVSFSET